MTEIVCYSSMAPPTNVIWKRNGKEIHIDGVQYDSKQIVADRINSHCYTILLVKRVVNVIGHLNFTCCVSNIYGSATFDIATNISGRLICTYNSILRTKLLRTESRYMYIHNIFVPHSGYI